MFKDNKYKRWYFDIVAKAQASNRKKKAGKYFERHHIIPKSFGGDNSKENLVLLTAREHFICHWLLTKFSNKNLLRKAQKAFGAMVTHRSFRKLTSKQFSIVKENIGPPPIETCSKGGRAIKGRKDTPEAIRNKRIAQKDKKCLPKARKLLSEYHKKSPEARARRVILHSCPIIAARKSKSLKESPRARAQRERLAEFNRNREYTKTYKCEHCGKQTTKAMHIRWHGNKCKLKV